MPGLSTGSIYFLTVPSDHTVACEMPIHTQCTFAWTNVDSGDGAEFVNFVPSIHPTTLTLKQATMVNPYTQVIIR